jgi:hypothetical protein
LNPTEGSPDWEASIAFAKEPELQRLIVGSPSLLPGVDDRPTAVAKEVRVPGAGRADVVAVDAEGEITIVECKRAVNPEMRRWVIGQVFSYAAGLWKLGYEDFERSFARRGTALTKQFKDVPGWDKETFRRTVSENLATGAFRLVIAADEIPDKLKRSVVFLNCHTPPEVRVLALKLRRAADDGIQTPVREVYGENCAEINPLEPTWPPDRWTLMAGIRSPDAAVVAEDLLDWAEDEPRLTVRYTPTGGVIETHSGSRVFRIAEHREIRVSRRVLAAHRLAVEPKAHQQLLQDLDKIGVRFDGERSKAPLQSLAEESKGEEFLALMERLLGTLPA